VLRLVLLAVVLLTLTALAAARPQVRSGAGERSVAAACVEPSMVLPPGHPPVPGFQPRGQGVELPPGHPPIGGQPRRAGPLPGLAPTFEAPATLEI
jgi:hypothetical protein